MSIKVQSIISQNITIVFDSVDLQSISGSELKTLMGRETRAMIMDTPEMIIVVYPPAPTIVQIGDRRVRINLPQIATELGTVHLWDLATRVSSIIPAESTPIAYGFNYNIGVSVESVDAHDLLIHQFVCDSEKLNQKLGGSLISIMPRFRFKRGDNRYDLLLESVDAANLKIHLNVHFELSEGILPEAGALHQAYEAEYNRLVTMLPPLFES